MNIQAKEAGKKVTFIDIRTPQQREKVRAGRK